MPNGMTSREIFKESSLGRSLRYWRKAKKLSQQDLALKANISTRHLSFIETNKTKPSRAIILQLATALKLPLRQCNALLVSAGYRLEYHQYELDDPEMSKVRFALKRLLNQHEPFPAFVVNQRYDLLKVNQGFNYLMTQFVDAETVSKYQNFYRLIFARDGLQPYFLDWSFVSSFLLARLRQEALTSQNQAVQELFEELMSSIYFPNLEHKGMEDVGELPVISFKLKKKGLEMHFFSTITL